jgi:hypothetical protein
MQQRAANDRRPRDRLNPDKSGQLIFGTNGAGFFATDLGDSTPHGGKIRSVTSNIAAGDYDDGLQGFNASSIGRSNALSGLKTGQWAKYRVNVPLDGYYDIHCKAASTTGGTFHMEFNGVNVTGPVAVKSSGLTDVSIRHVNLTAGDQYMKYFPESDSVEINSFQLIKQ